MKLMGQSIFLFIVLKFGHYLADQRSTQGLLSNRMNECRLETQLFHGLAPGKGAQTRTLMLI